MDQWVKVVFLANSEPFFYLFNECKKRLCQVGNRLDNRVTTSRISFGNRVLCGYVCHLWMFLSGLLLQLLGVDKAKLRPLIKPYLRGMKRYIRPLVRNAYNTRGIFSWETPSSNPTVHCCIVCLIFLKIKIFIVGREVTLRHLSTFFLDKNLNKSLQLPAKNLLKSWNCQSAGD